MGEIVVEYMGKAKNGTTNKRKATAMNGQEMESSI